MDHTGDVMASKLVARPYVPELGQMSFGNQWGDYQIPEDLHDMVCNGITNLVMKAGGNQSTSNYAIEFKNDVFEMHPYYWGTELKEQGKPNFKCGNLEIRWYKFIGRGMSCNKKLTMEEFEKTMAKCLGSLKSNNNVKKA
jgi:hypothetical protein